MIKSSGNDSVIKSVNNSVNNRVITEKMQLDE